MTQARKTHKTESVYYEFPGLLHPVRRSAVNDNNIPLLKTILKHSIIMFAALVTLYIVRSIFL